MSMSLSPLRGGSRAKRFSLSWRAPLLFKAIERQKIQTVFKLLANDVQLS